MGKKGNRDITTDLQRTCCEELIASLKEPENLEKAYRYLTYLWKKRGKRKAAPVLAHQSGKAEKAVAKLAFLPPV